MNKIGSTSRKGLFVGKRKSGLAPLPHTRFLKASKENSRASVILQCRWRRLAMRQDVACCCGSTVIGTMKFGGSVTGSTTKMVVRKAVLKRGWDLRSGLMAFSQLSSSSENPIPGDDRTEVPLCDLEKTKILVETAMLAAVSGMMSLLLTLIKLDSYLYYLMPFPLVLASVRSGKKAAGRTMFATFFLIAAVTYILLYGLVGITLGMLWSIPSPWWVTFPACTGAYTLAVMCYVFVASFLLHEDLIRLVVYNAQAAVGQLSNLLGMQVVPSTPTIIAVLLFMLTVKGIMYVVFLHIGYGVVLEGMGYRVGKLPQFIEKSLWPLGRPSSFKNQ